MHAPAVDVRVHRWLAIGGGAYMITLRCTLAAQHTLPSRLMLESISILRCLSSLQVCMHAPAVPIRLCRMPAIGGGANMLTLRFHARSTAHTASTINAIIGV